MTDYASAGVDVDAGERAVALMRASIRATLRTEVIGDVGGFAGLFDISAARAMSRPILATSTDGVGTKIAVARAMDIHHTIGVDLVAMVIDDLVVCGAEPLFMTDYIATGAVDPERIARIVEGISTGCIQAGCTLIGGETAEHPGLMAPDEYDLAGAGVGIVDADAMLGPHRVYSGDAVVAMASSGLHSNGYSLARMVLLGVGAPGLNGHVPEFSCSVGEELLAPTRIYAQDCLALVRTCEIHALSHITGGGIAANLARVLPVSLAADIDRSTWCPPGIFTSIARIGDVDRSYMEQAFNMGIGMIAVVGSDHANAAIDLLRDRGVTAWQCGLVRTRTAEDVGDATAKGGLGGVVTLRGDFAN
jgi:phosphoribosylformylglycinamidine cyclo-ligase